MQNKKLLSVIASLALAVSLAVPVSAADEFLPDVTNVSATSVPGGVKITWDAVENADGYTIYFGTTSVVEDGGTYDDSLTVGDVSEYNVENLSVDTIYYFAVAADDSTGTYLGSYNYSKEVSAIAGEAIVVPDPEPEPEPSSVPDPNENLPVVDPNVIDPDNANEDSLPTPEDSSATPEDSSATPEDPTLPDSGPATAAVLLASAGGAYFYRKFRK